MKKKVKKSCKWDLENRKQYYIIYTVLFFLFFVAAFGIFKFYGKAPVWDSDAISQHYPNFIYTGEWIRDIIQDFLSTGKLHVRQWDSTIGFGQDVYNVVSLRPSSVFAVFWSKDTTIIFIWVVIAIRLFLVGISFSEYCFYMKLNRNATLAAAMLYTFSSYSLVYGVKHYMFVDMMIFLPLLCLGLEKIIHRQRPWLFIIGVAISAWTYFYMLYIVALFVVIYFIIRFFTMDGDKKLKSFFCVIFKCAVNGIVGVLMAAASLLPTLFLSMESSRAGETVSKSYASFWHYARIFYVEFVTGIFTPSYMYLGLVLGFSGLAGICVVYLFVTGKKRLDLKIGLWFIGILLLIPYASYVFNGFSGYTLRWSFGLTFCVCFIIAAVLPEIFCLSKVNIIKICVCEAIYFLILIVFWFLGQNISFGGIFSVLLFDIVVLIYNIKTDFWNTGKGKYILYIILFFEILVKSLTLYSPYGENYLKEFHDSEIVEREVEALGAQAVKNLDDEEVFRVDEVDDNFYSSVYNRNYGLRTGTNGLSSYYSYSTGLLKKYISDLGIAQQPTPFCILGMTHRTIINALNSVKYVVSLEGSNDDIPYGYKKKTTVDIQNKYGETENATVYENKYFISYMYAYDSYISEEQFDSLNALEKEQAMLQGVVLNEKVDYPETDLNSFVEVLLSKDEIISQLREKYADSQDIIINDNSIVTKKDGLSVTIEFKGMKNAETYVYFDDLEYIPLIPVMFKEEILGPYASKLDEKQFDFKYLFWERPTSSRIVLNGAETIYLNNEYAQYYSGPAEVVGNLGYSKEATNKVTVYFTKMGEYAFSDFEIAGTRMKSIKKMLNQLHENGVDDIVIDKNVVTGNINLPASKFVCINIPYSVGWKAYVNGEETQIYPANDMYMAIRADAGENNIMLVYNTPGMVSGFWISVITVMIVLVSFGYDKLKRKNKSRNVA